MAEQNQLEESFTEYCSNITTKMIGIKWSIVNVSKYRWPSKAIGPSFYLKPERIFYTTLFLDENSLFLRLGYESTDAKIKIKRKMTLFDYYYVKLHEENDEKIFSLEINKDADLIGPEIRERFNNLPHDTLTINLCINIIEVLTQNVNPFENDLDPEKKLREDLKMMLENPVNSDVSLVVGKERIAAHWSILCSRSPYFKKMFDSGMKESIQNSITITDISFCTLKKLIQFLYTSEFIQRNDIQELLELYYAAEKNEVMDLRALCRRNIVSIATTENVTVILEVSLHHNDEAMKRVAIDFMRLYSVAVYQTESWKDFEKRDPGTAELIRIYLQEN